MGLFGKSARIAALEIENDTLSARLAAEKKRAAASGRALSEKVRECEIVDASLMPLFRIINRMAEDYGYPAADIASDLQIEEQCVRSTFRALEALGLAKRHPFFSEDDHQIRGSGYSLTGAGAKLASVAETKVANVEDAIFAQIVSNGSGLIRPNSAVAGHSYPIPGNAADVSERTHRTIS